MNKQTKEELECLFQNTLSWVMNLIRKRYLIVFRDKDSLFFINLMRLKVCDIPEFQGSYQSINDHFSKIATLLNAFDSEGDKTSRFFNRDRYHLYAHIHAVYRQTEEL